VSAAPEEESPEEESPEEESPDPAVVAADAADRAAEFPTA
jgi:hypothetical protein